MQSINIPTRFADNYKSLLLDHIYTNLINQHIISEACIFDISDHLPVFIIARNAKCHSESKISTSAI